jgi:hypothetical protein
LANILAQNERAAVIKNDDDKRQKLMRPDPGVQLAALKVASVRRAVATLRKESARSLSSKGKAR